MVFELYLVLLTLVVLQEGRLLTGVVASKNNSRFIYLVNVRGRWLLGLLYLIVGQLLDDMLLDQKILPAFLY